VPGGSIAADGDWQAALEKAQQQGFSVEAVVITKPVTTAAELSAMHDAAIALSNTYGRRAFVMAASSALRQQTWSEYLTEQKAITWTWRRRASWCAPAARQ
jgi:hypothetical protein